MLIDFGVAKLTEVQDHNDRTQTLNLAFTPDYASPERIQGKPATTASEVYSLGVILYELLAGRRPYETTGESLAEVVRRICDTVPLKPSATTTQVGRVRTREGEIVEVTPESISELRGVMPRRLALEIRGDLDRIIMKAIDKDVPRRYQTVDQLTDEIGRYLKGEPIRARDGGLGYRVNKYVRRNKVPVAAAAGFVLLLLAGIAVISQLAIRANRAAESERDQRLFADHAAVAEQKQRIVAEQREKTANEMVELFDDLLVSADPRRTGDRDYRARDLIDQFAKELGSRKVDDPVVQARLLLSAASAFAGNGEYKTARKKVQEAAGLFSNHLGPAHSTTVAARLRAAQLTLLGSDPVAAERQLLRLVELDDPSGSADPEWNLVQFRTLVSLAEAQTRQNKLDVAEVTLQQAESKISLLREADLAEAKYQVKRRRKVLLIGQGHLEQALPFVKEEYQKAKEQYGEFDYRTAIAGDLLARIYSRQKRFDEAIGLYESSLRSSRKFFGKLHPDTLVRVMNLASANYNAKQFAAADVLFREYESTHAALHRYQGDHHHGMLKRWSKCLFETGKFEQAEQLLHRCYDSKAVGRDSPSKDCVQIRKFLAEQFRAAGRTELADNWLVAPETPIGVQPADLKVGKSGEVTLVANDFVHGAKDMQHHTTRWQIRAEHETYEYSPTLDVTTGDHLNQLSVPAGMLLPNRDYFWRLAHVGQNRMQSEFSSEQKFRVDELDYRLQPIELRDYFNRDVVYSPGDASEDCFQHINKQLLIDGYKKNGSGQAFHGVPQDGVITPHRLGDYNEFNVIQFKIGSEPVTIALPNFRFKALRFLLASGQGGYKPDGSAIHVTLEYDDGTTEQFKVNSPDWYSKIDYRDPNAGMLSANIVRHGIDRGDSSGKVQPANLALFDTMIVTV